MKSLHIQKKRLTSFQIIILGFLIVILTGTILLMLPFATRDGQGAKFFDALFTATSATCVTGLVVCDTATYWSVFGQVVILVLIQIGGMGVVTLAVSMALISGKKISLKQRSTMQEAIAAPSVGGIVRLTGFIIRATVAIELTGAVCMLPVFWRDFGCIKGIWFSVFHSVSAFCNAGFDLMGAKSPFSSLSTYVSNPLINLVILTLIIVGGIGFLTWDDVKRNGIHFRRYRMQSKVILLTSMLLIVIPFLFFYFYEFGREVWNNLPTGERVVSALFQTVTPRTAGFNTVDLTRFDDVTQMVMIFLMLIGGSPGSTAGGMKTTTIAVLMLTMISVFRRKEDTECFGRRFDYSAIRYAVTVLMMYLCLFLTGGLVISGLEGLPVLTCLFETASAIGTVGLSLGITQGLCLASKLILITLMYFGRVGGLTLIFAAISDKEKNISKLPREKITVG